jgi:trehalose 6-phosphate synthase/phosphatase
MDAPQQERVEVKYSYASKRLLLLDYDGTLVPFHNKPEAAKPDTQLLHLLSHLAEDAGNRLVIISGRDHHTLDNWLGFLPVDIIAEHGAWYKERDKEWKSHRDAGGSWKKEFAEVLAAFTRSTPGALIEEKTYSISWHYRQCEAGLANRRVAEIREALESKATRLGLQLLNGDKVIEIRNPGINKGKTAIKLTYDAKYDFIMAIGDDATDEDMFSALPSGAVTIKVGTRVTAASNFVNNYTEVRALLHQLRNSDIRVQESATLQLTG